MKLVKLVQLAPPFTLQAIVVVTYPTFGCVHALQCYRPSESSLQEYVSGSEGLQNYTPGISSQQKAC